MDWFAFIFYLHSYVSIWAFNVDDISILVQVMVWSHYNLKQCLLVINQLLVNKFGEIIIKIQQFSHKTMALEMSAILSWPQRVK